MPYADLDSMTLDEMQAEFVTLGGELSTIDGRRRALLRCMDQKKAQASAAATVDKLSPGERDALRAALEEQP